MGNFYINHTVCGLEVPAVIQQLSGSEAYVSHEKNGCFVIYDQRSEIEANPAIEKLARVPAGWNHPAEKDSRQINMLEHVPAAKPLHTLAGHALGIELSQRPSARMLSVMIVDDDIMMYWLFEGGKIADTYNSNPGYNEVSDPPRPPEGGDSSKLCAAFACNNSNEVDQVLRADRGSYVFEFERHQALTAILGLPQEAVAVGFHYIQAGDFQQEFDASDFVPVPR